MVLTALCLPFSAFAQPRLRVPEFYFGFHAGVSASSVIFQPTVANMTPITKASVLGGNGGLVFRYAGHKYCAVQVELNYMHRGWAETGDAGRYSRELHYLELPLLMNINFGSERWRGFFNLGPQIGSGTDHRRHTICDSGSSFRLGISCWSGILLPLTQCRIVSV